MHDGSPTLYSLLRQVGANAVEIAQRTRRRFEEFPDTRVQQSAVEELERKGDRLTAEILGFLDIEAQTPAEREEFFWLVRSLDKVVDGIEHASALLDVYRVDAATEPALMQCQILVGCVQSLARSRLDAGEARAALDAAERGLAIDGLNEGLWRLALEAESALGLREAVAERYERLRDLLDERLGLEPERDTRALYLELLGQS